MKMTILLSVAGLLTTGLVTTKPEKTISEVAPEAALPSRLFLCSNRPQYKMPIPEDLPVGKMRVSKATLYHGDVLEVKFTTPHASNLAIKTPDGKFFYVVFPSEGATSKMMPLVDSDKFARLNFLRIRTDQLKADPYTYGVEENKPVFTKSGTYTLIMGHNLHVDDETELAIVKIKYRHQKSRLASGKDKGQAIASN